MTSFSDEYRKKPPFEISHYDKDNPQLNLYFGDRHMSFSVAPVAPDSHEWLAGVLHRQISELIEIEVKKAVAEQQAKLRALCGLK